MHPALTWYYHHSAAEVGLSSSPLAESTQHSCEPPHPTERQLRAAERQAGIRRALRELSPRLQAILECCYELRPHGTQLIHEHGIAAGPVARALFESLTHRDQTRLDRDTKLALILTAAAHRAFGIVYGPPPGSRVEARRQRVERWLNP